MDKQYAGIVLPLYPDAEQTFVEMNPQVDTPTRLLRLEVGHPNYASVFALLMASAANKKPIQIAARMAAIDEATATITAVSFSFGD